jgi:ParB-like chromosome segregation protein Spo0J
MNGGTVPPLEVTPVMKVVCGLLKVIAVAAAMNAADAGKPVDRIHIVPFVGNDVERLARVMTSNNQLPLTPLEQAQVIKELATTFNLTTQEIAKLVHKSVPTVEKLLTLATANHDVQQIVKNGKFP